MGAMRTIFGVCVNLGMRASLETAVWLVLPIAANIPDAALGERKRRENIVGLVRIALNCLRVEQKQFLGPHFGL